MGKTRCDFYEALILQEERKINKGPSLS